MKTTLLRFSGTGNSLAVARMIACGVGDASIVSVQEFLRRDHRKLDCEACGFVFPVYCQDVPEMVRRLVRGIEFPSDAYIFGVATHNGDPGYSHFTLDALLRKKGMRLSAGFAVLMPGNSITPGDSMNPEPEIRRRLEASPKAVNEILERVIKRDTNRFAGTNTLRKRVKGWRNMFRHRYIHRVPESFHVTDACDGCGVCARICPEGNIAMEGSRPAWSDHCQMCLACIHWCPRQAIQNGEGTIHRRRYHHPDVSITDMLA